MSSTKQIGTAWLFEGLVGFNKGLAKVLLTKKKMSEFPAMGEALIIWFN